MIENEATIERDIMWTKIEKEKNERRTFAVNLDIYRYRLRLYDVSLLNKS
jgi:hypothetical protein